MSKFKCLHRATYLISSACLLLVGSVQGEEVFVKEPEKVIEEDLAKQATTKASTEEQQREQLVKAQESLEPQWPIETSEESKEQVTVDTRVQEGNQLYQAASKGIEILSSAAQDAWNKAVKQLRKIADFLRVTFVALEKRLPAEARTRFNALADGQLAFLEDGLRLQKLAPTLTRANAKVTFVTDIESGKTTVNTDAYKSFMRGWELYARTFDDFVTAVNPDNPDEQEAFDAAKSALIDTLNVLNKLNIPLRKEGAVNSYPITDALFKGISFEAALEKVQDLKPGENLFK